MLLRRASRIIAPVGLPLLMQEVRSWLKIADSNTEDDAFIDALIRSATEQCEKYTKRALITQTWMAYLDSWPLLPSDNNYWEGWREGPETMIGFKPRFLEFPYPPLQSITSIKSYDDTDVGTLYSSANYMVDTSSFPGRVVLRRSASAPVATRSANGIEFVFVAGYGDDPASVPESLRNGMLRFIAHLYEHRGDDTESVAIKSGAQMLWDSYRMVRM